MKIGKTVRDEISSFFYHNPHGNFLFICFHSNSIFQETISNNLINFFS